MVTTKLWSTILQLFGVVWVMPQSVIEMLGSWRRQRGNRLLVPIWKIAPFCLMWCLWKEQNAHSFEDCETGSNNLKKLVIQILFMWRVTLQFMPECFSSNFLDRILLSCSIRGIMYTFYVLWVAPLYTFFFFFFFFFQKYTLFLKKKRKKRLWVKKKYTYFLFFFF
jgi:hypothetical protein